MERKDFAQFLLRIGIGFGFLSAVMDRLGWLGLPGEHNIVWGNWQNFLMYTNHLIPFASKNLTLFLGALATIAETVFAILLIVGYKTRLSALGSCLMTLVFILCMGFSVGLKASFNYSVPIVSAASLLLSSFTVFKWSIDNLSYTGNRILW